MGDWLSWASDSLGDAAPSFDVIAHRVAALPGYGTALGLDPVRPGLAEHEAIVYIARRLLSEPPLAAASRCVYESNWIIRQATVALLGVAEGVAPGP